MRSYYVVIDISKEYSDPQHAYYFYLDNSSDVFGKIRWFIEDRGSALRDIRVFRYEKKMKWECSYDLWENAVRNKKISQRYLFINKTVRLYESSFFDIPAATRSLRLS